MAAAVGLDVSVSACSAMVCSFQSVLGPGNPLEQVSEHCEFHDREGWWKCCQRLGRGVVLSRFLPDTFSSLKNLYLKAPNLPPASQQLPYIPQNVQTLF